MILVTGATGLVGSHLVSQLVSKGESIRALYRTTIPSIPGAENIDWFQADILDVIALEAAMEGVTEVYHCAAIVSFSAKGQDAMHLTNIEGTANIVNASLEAGIRKMVFVSSVAALGRIRTDQAINETMDWTEETSNSEYGKTKYLAEMEVWRGIGEGLNAVIVNPVIILGSGDWTKGSSAIFKSAYDQFPWYTEGSSGFVDVLDVVAAMQALMASELSAQRYILSGANLGYRDVFNMIADGFGKKRPHLKVSPLLAEIVWRLEGIKSMFTGKQPLLTKETSRTARAKVVFDNSKLLKALPSFQYRAPVDSINRICAELKKIHNL
jgi:nucleoside-diphosphate-sugar epimerase